MPQSETVHGVLGKNTDSTELYIGIIDPYVTIMQPLSNHHETFIEPLFNKDISTIESLFNYKHLLMIIDC